MTAFLANLVRNEDKIPEPFTYKDFMVEWSEVWDAVANPVVELTEEEEARRTEALLGKVINLNTWFGGISKQ